MKPSAAKEAVCRGAATLWESPNEPASLQRPETLRREKGGRPAPAPVSLLPPAWPPSACTTDPEPERSQGQQSPFLLLTRRCCFWPLHFGMVCHVAINDWIGPYSQIHKRGQLKPPSSIIPFKCLHYEVHNMTAVSGQTIKSKAHLLLWNIDLRNSS